jgi:hypothetical protein
VQDNVLRAEDLLFEPVQLSRHFALCVILPHNDAPKHEKRILRVNDRKVVVAGLVEEQDFHVWGIFSLPHCQRQLLLPAPAARYYHNRRF